MYGIQKYPKRPALMRFPLLSNLSFLKSTKNWRTTSFFALVFATNLAFFYLTGRVLFSNGITPLEIVIFLLFSLTFCWISISFWNAVLGFFLICLKIDITSMQGLKTSNITPPAIKSRTALVMPVRNEDPDRAMACLATTLNSLALTSSSSFDAYILSDTDQVDLLQSEKSRCQELKQTLPIAINLYYRHRVLNVGHKAGNIAEFCQRWGSNYDFMVVLDSDSIMEGTTLVELVSLMELNPQAGLIQTAPIPTNQTTLFGRILQFSSSLYGPLISWGQSFGYSNSANYWGHNAIIRMSAFIETCGLPSLPGKPPFGGEILSHDFVEASFLKRAGWDLFLLPHLKGTYEMVPGDLLSYVKRERRWAQGSLQHLHLVVSKDIHFMNRIHFLMGAMGYLSSLLWLGLLLASTTYILSLQTGTTFFFLEPYFPSIKLTSGSWDPMLSPLLITGCILFLPKLLSLTVYLIATLKNPREAPLLVLSFLLEIIFAILLSPILMFYHTAFVFRFLTGGTTNWEPSEDRDTEVSWSRAFRSTLFISTTCLIWASLIIWYSPLFFLWMLPIFMGLALANPIICLTTDRVLLEWSERLKLFSILEGDVSPDVDISFGDYLTQMKDPKQHSSVSLEPPMENPRKMLKQNLTW